MRIWICYKNFQARIQNKSIKVIFRQDLSRSIKGINTTISNLYLAEKLLKCIAQYCSIVHQFNGRPVRTVLIKWRTDWLQCYPFPVNFSSKFGICTVVSVNGTLVEAKMCTFTLESTHFIFNKCLIYVHSRRTLHEAMLTEEKSKDIVHLTFFRNVSGRDKGGRRKGGGYLCLWDPGPNWIRKYWKKLPQLSVLFEKLLKALLSDVRQCAWRRCRWGRLKIQGQ